MENSFDFEGMVEGLHNFKKMVDRFQQNLANVLSEYLLLSNEGCGFIVNELAKEAGKVSCFFCTQMKKRVDENASTPSEHTNCSEN